MEEVFYAFCDSTKKGSKAATDKTMQKICKDCKICDSKLNSNAVDIALRKHLGNTCKEMDFAKFNAFLETHLAEEYSKAKGIGIEDAAEEIKRKIIEGAPKTHGVTSTSKDDATSRLTDVKGYTGSHVQRFDAETGKGKGKTGREETAENTGYVGGYKLKDTYDKKH